MTILIVCGGRHYMDRDFVFRTMDYLAARRTITYVVEGGQTGADTHAREWAKARGVPFHTEQAEWHLYGGPAGPIRNRKMLIDWEPDGCIAFNGDKGTRNMKNQAAERGVPIYEPDLHREAIDADSRHSAQR